MTSESISLEITGDLRFLPKQYLTAWADGGFIVRKSARDIWQYIQDTVADRSRVGTYLAGPMGVGKSSIMYYAVHKAREEGWLVIYIPRCDEWLRKGNACKTDWYSYLFDAVLEGLTYVKADKVKRTYEYCIPPKGLSSWRDASFTDGLSLEYFQGLFRQFREKILREVDVPVLLAFDESQALFENGINMKDAAPFSLIDWSSYYERGCVFVTATADSPYRRSIRSGHERHIRNTGCLLDDEFSLWIKTCQFDKILKHPQFNVEYLPEIISVTGNIPRELVLLNEEYCDPTMSFNQVLEDYCDSRQSAYEERYRDMAKQYPDDVKSYLRAFVKFFTQIKVKRHDIPVTFLDTGLAYINDKFVVPLNSNALKCFFKILTNSDNMTLEHELLNELHDLTSDLPAKVGYAFEKLFGLNLLYHTGDIVLKYQSISATAKQTRIIQVRHFLTLDANKPRKTWKDYPLGTLVAHSKSGEARMDFIYFGGPDCVLFFELTVAEDVCSKKYPKLKDDSRLKLILDRVSKWLGCQVRANKDELLPPRDYKGVLEYIVVSSRVDDEDGVLFPGNKKKEAFSWIKVMDRNDLRSFFPESHIEKLASLTNDAKRLKRARR